MLLYIIYNIIYSQYKKIIAKNEVHPNFPILEILNMDFSFFQFFWWDLKD